MEVQLQRRLAANEASFRDVNEAIARGQWPGEGAKPVAFRCECAHEDCNLMIELTLGEYEQVRAYSRRFMCQPDHEFPDLETVVATGAGYVVVEKRDRAAELCDEADPRD